MMKVFKKLALVASVTLALAGGGVHAASSVSSSFSAGLNQLSDNSAESLINVAGQANILDVGDRLRGIFGLDTGEPISSGGATREYNGVDVNQFAGIFDITLISKIDTGGVGNGRFQYVFAPTPVANSGFGADFGAPEGTAIVFFEKNTFTYSRINPACSTTGAGGDCEGTITGAGSSIFWYAGFTSGVDINTGLGTDGEFWLAEARTDDISQVGNAGSTVAGGTFNIGLHQLAGGVGNTLGALAATECALPVPGLHMCGSGSLLGKGSAVSPYNSFNNVDFVVNVVPEPGSLGLLGLGLGLGALALRRRRQV